MTLSLEEFTLNDVHQAEILRSPQSLPNCSLLSAITESSSQLASVVQPTRHRNAFLRVLLFAGHVPAVRSSVYILLVPDLLA